MPNDLYAGAKNECNPPSFEDRDEYEVWRILNEDEEEEEEEE